MLLFDIIFCFESSSILLEEFSNYASIYARVLENLIRKGSVKIASVFLFFFFFLRLH